MIKTHCTNVNKNFIIGVRPGGRKKQPAASATILVSPLDPPVGGGGIQP